MPSRRFLLTVAVLFGLLHAYIGLRVLPALPVPGWAVWLGAVWLLSSWLLVPAGLLARFLWKPPLADRLAWAGMLCMGLFSSLLVATVLRDLLLLVARWLGESSVALGAWSAVAVVVLALLVSLAGFINARRLARLVEVDVPLAGLPVALQGFRIAQISDIHVGPTIKGDYLARIVDRVNRLQPDLVAVTGDLVDGSVAELSVHTAHLGRLQARHGSYFVTGNHEYYAGAESWVAELRRLGLHVLMNEHVVLSHDGAQLVVAGVTDYGAHHFDPAQRSDPLRAAHGAPAGAPRVLLAHQPRSAPAAEQAGFDLQLSGHTHGGQFWPWNHFVPLQQPFTAGLHRLQRLWVYVSRGTGYWGPPKRFGAPSEITCLRLVSAPGST
ncbi:metallophosphoesterase [Uliginosibacterium sp. H1]|uniref:metallophosphoesterase n=1 Tax=Uliginosibacterium sp. H1 TaxID=3114757 RepID=UPI002E19730E|nr:metallophosphoesterase [Uliginosibacterium sp. H1]